MTDTADIQSPQRQSALVKAPSVVFTVIAVVAMAGCLVAFITGARGLGVSAVSVALLATGAALSWGAEESRRRRDPRRS